MSKKNSKATKARYHQLSIQREKQAALEKQQKADKKQQREAASRLGGASKKVSKPKRKGIRIRKGVTIKGVKVVDSESKKRAKQLLLEEDADRQMDVETPQKPVKKFARKLKTKKKVTVAVRGAVPME